MGQPKRIRPPPPKDLLYTERLSELLDAAKLEAEQIMDGAVVEI